MNRNTIRRACLVGVFLGALTAVGTERIAEASAVYVEMDESKGLAQKPDASLAGMSSTTSSPMSVGASGPRVTAPPSAVPSSGVPSSPISTGRATTLSSGSPLSFGRPSGTGAFGSTLGSSTVGSSSFGSLGSIGSMSSGLGSFSR
jgi:hypothetical protein